jgi:HNH endonuclease
MRIKLLLPKMTRYIPETKCLIYTGFKVNGGGYPRCSHFGKKDTNLFHRAIFKAVFGFLPQNVHHSCKNKRCLNAAHLKGMSVNEHSEAHLRTHCLKGHELTPENTYIGVGGHGETRRCRVCKRDYERGRARVR